VIEVSPSTAVMLYLGLTLVGVLGLWGFNHYRTRNRSLKIDAQQLLVCEYCHNVYLEANEASVTQCPQCQSFNKLNSYKKTDG
jgi:ribosomal protein L37AE/L43A